MSQTHVATQDCWVICFSDDEEFHNFNAVGEGAQIETGLSNMEVYLDRDEAIARYKDFVSDFEPED